MSSEIVLGGFGPVGKALCAIGGVMAVDADVMSPYLLDACKGAKRIYHFASKSDQYCLDNPIESANIMLAGTVRVLEVAKKLGASVVFASSIGAENPNEPYGLYKKIGEELCAFYNKQGVPTVSLRFANVYGGKDAYVVSRFMEAKKERKPLVVYGDSTRDFIHVDDVARACLVAPVKGTVIEIGTGITTTIGELARLIGGDIVYKKGVSTHRVANIQKALRMGWKPEISLKEGLQKMYDGLV
jgi:nucleoside-diphosphate-sugar epimerase